MPTRPDPPRARLGDRALLPRLRPRAYLNHAAISPPSRPVVEAMAAAVADYEAEGLAAFPAWLEQRARLKRRLARLIDASPSDLALLPNTSTALNAVALCLPWRRGDRVVVFEGEFPTNVTPWLQAARTFDLRTRFLSLAPLAEPGGPDLQPLRAALARGVRLVSISLVQFQTGLRVPIEQIHALCAEAGAELCVDAIQAVGALPVDAPAHCDYLACGGHKWLMGPEGTAFLYVHPDRISALRPTLAGWLSHASPVDFLTEGGGHLRYDKPIRAAADFLELGAPATVGLAGLEASVALIEQLGPPAIFAHITRYLDALEAGLVERGFRSLRCPDRARQSGVLSLTPPDARGAPAWSAALAPRGISCASPDGCLRFAPHWPNALDEIPYVLEAVDAVAAAPV